MKNMPIKNDNAALITSMIDESLRPSLMLGGAYRLLLYIGPEYLPCRPLLLPLQFVLAMDLTHINE